MMDGGGLAGAGEHHGFALVLLEIIDEALHPLELLGVGGRCDLADEIGVADDAAGDLRRNG